VGRIQKVTGIFVIFGAISGAADLKPRTVQAFDDYARRVEARQDAQSKGPAFLWSDQNPDRLRRLRAGEILTESVTGPDAQVVPDGLIHDWIGAVFLPHATLEKTLALLQDYGDRKVIYKPEVIDSRLVQREGDVFHIYMRLLTKKVITVVLDTYYDVTWFPIVDKHVYSRSISTRIQEVDNVGKPDEHDLPEGKDHGFLWRLNTYWRFAERDGGVYMECEAVSLTRDIPTGLGWLIAPIIRDLPKESLVNTLQKTREALSAPRAWTRPPLPVLDHRNLSV
jgi:hypothetical protein